MTIRKFLILIFCVSISLAIYVNYKYLSALEIQKNNKPIENYNIIEINCSSSFRMSSNIKISYIGEIYIVTVSNGICSKIAEKKINPKFYYMKEKNLVFLENQYLPFTYVYLTYFASLFLPLIGFIVYRKELNNNYKTM